MKKVKKGAFSRGLSLAKLGLKTGATAAGRYFTGESNEEYLAKQMQTIAKELGELKGSLMKAGQGLSMYGEHFLPPKANAFLKSLQFESPPLDWEAIEAVIEKELGLGVFQDLEIDSKALASASLGQVHLATDKKNGEQYAIKVQYPGVEDAIYSDIRNLKRILSLANIIPTGLRTDQLFLEVQEMLVQETNYDIEKSWTEKVYQWTKNDERFLVPKVIPKYCTSKILTTKYIKGETIDSEAVQNLSQDDRNHIGFSFLNHYLDELFLFKSVQTDPHLGNYRVQIQSDQSPPKLVLLDFGAMREVPDHFGIPYLELVRTGIETGDRDEIIKWGTKLKYLMEDDPEELKQTYVELCILINEGFCPGRGGEFFNDKGEYDFRNSDLPKRVALKGTEIIKNFKLRAPPRETIFLDRKLGGTFTFLSVLGFYANSEQWIKEKLNNY